MALQQKRQMVNNVLFKLDAPVPGKAPTNPDDILAKTGIRVVPDAEALAKQGDVTATNPDTPPADGYSLNDVAALLKKK